MNKDFKYVIQDFSSTQIGSRFTFEEMLMDDRVPFKFQSILRLYILKDVEASVEIGKHILSVSSEDFSYQVYNQLKIKIRFCVPYKDKFKVVQKKFIDFKTYSDEHWDENHVIQDITISNLALIAFNL